MGLGRAGATSAARSGALISIILLTSYRVADYFLRDRATLSRLVGTLATDIMKVGIATGAAIAVATGVATVFSAAIGPLVAVIVVGVLVSASLTAIDNQYRITDWVVAGIDEMGEDVHVYIKDRKRRLQQAGEQAIDSVIDYALESAFEGARALLIRTARHYFRRLTVPRIN